MLTTYNIDRNGTPPSDCFWKLNLKIFPSGDKPILCKKNNKTVTLKSDVSTCVATVTDFMTILEFIDYSKFERFSNVADEIS